MLGYIGFRLWNQEELLGGDILDLGCFVLQDGRNTSHSRIGKIVELPVGAFGRKIACTYHV